MQRPKTGSFLSGFIEDYVDERLAGFRIFFAENLRSDFDEVTLERASIPLRENIIQLLRRETEHILEDCISFANQLHVAILDSVVNHFHVMPGAVRPHVSATRLAIHLRGDFAENRRDHVKRFT